MVTTIAGAIAALAGLVIALLRWSERRNKPEDPERVAAEHAAEAHGWRVRDGGASGELHAKKGAPAIRGSHPDSKG